MGRLSRYRTLDCWDCSRLVIARFFAVIGIARGPNMGTGAGSLLGRQAGGNARFTFRTNRIPSIRIVLSTALHMS